MSPVPSVVEKAMQLARAGSAAALALAIGTAPDAAAAIGAYAVTTASAERLALVVGGIDGAQFRSDGSNLSVVVQKGTQDGLAIAGRAGGSGSYLGTLVPPTLTASRTYTLPDASVILAGSASALTSGRIPVAAAGGLLSDSANSPTLSGANLTVQGTLSATTITASTRLVGVSAPFTQYGLESSTGLGATNTTTNANGTYGFDLRRVAHTSTSGTHNSRSQSVLHYGTIGSGQTNSGSWTGLDVYNYRNSVAAGDTGTLSALVGAQVTYGHLNLDASTPTTTTVTGLKLTALRATGTIGTMYGLHVANGSTTVVPTTGYSIYVDDAIGGTAYAIYTNAGLVRFGGAVTCSSTLSVVPSGAQGRIVVGANNAGSYSSIDLNGNGSQTNWRIGSNITLGNAFEIIPSTATGGTTFTTPVATFSPTAIALNQAVTCSSMLTTAGNTGIGTTTPFARLVVADTTGGKGLEIVPNSAGSLLFEVYDRGGSAYYPARYLASAHSFEQGAVTITGTSDGILTVAGKITAKAAVPGSFDDSSLANLAADIQSYLASILT